MKDTRGSPQWQQTGLRKGLVLVSCFSWGPVLGTLVLVTQGWEVAPTTASEANCPFSTLPADLLHRPLSFALRMLHCGMKGNSIQILVIQSGYSQ